MQNAVVGEEADLRCDAVETSLMYRRKSKGPGTVPCGTPDVTGSQVDWDPFTITRCLRLDKKEMIQSSVLPRIPYESILANKRW